MLFDRREAIPANDAAFVRSATKARVRKVEGGATWLCLHPRGAGAGPTPLAAIDACRRAMGLA